MIKSPITSSAKRIANTKSVKALKFNRKDDHKKLIKWIEGSTKEINKVKLPKKRELKKLSKGLDAKISGGGGSLLGLALLAGGGAALLSGGKGGLMSSILPALGLGAGAYGLSRFFRRKPDRNFTRVRPDRFQTPRSFSPRTPQRFTPRVRGIPRTGGLLGAAFAGLEYGGRVSEGQTQTQAIAGTAGSTLGGTAGAVGGTKLGTMIGGAIGAAFGGIGALPGAAIGGVLGGLLGGYGGSMAGGAVTDKLTGADKINARLKEQEEKQKAATKLTFTDIVDKFNTVVIKFEKLSFSGRSRTSFGARGTIRQDGTDSMDYQTEGMNNRAPSVPSKNESYDGPVSGDQFFPLPGGILSTKEVGVPGGEYGAPRNYGGHSGQDIGGLNPGAAVVAWKTGKLRYTGSVEAGDTILTIDHGGGVQSVYKHVVPTVASGSVVYGGQQIATLFDSVNYDPHLHFEVWNAGSHQDPMSYLKSSQKTSAPLSLERAKESHQENIVGETKPQVNTVARQQTPEEFFKGSQYEEEFNKYKSQFYGREKRKRTSGTLEVNAVKNLQNMYNSYVRTVREKREQDAIQKPQVTPQKPQVTPQRLVPTVPMGREDTSSTTIFAPVGEQQVQYSGQPQAIPVPIASNQNQQTLLPTVSSTEVLNSLWTTLLLTKLSEA